MDVQDQLDRQFGLESTSTYLNPLESNSLAVSKDIESSQDETAENAVPSIPGDDQATTTALNNLAFKHGPQQDTGALQVSSGNSLSTSPEPQHNLVPEPAPAKSPKRKSLEPPETDIIAPPSKHQATNRAMTKPVSGELRRPTNPLNSGRLQLTSLDNPSRDKFDFPDDVPTPKVLSRESGQPIGQLKKARGRPRKKVAEVIPDQPSIVHRALVPKITHPETSLQPGDELSLNPQHNQERGSFLLNGKVGVTRSPNRATTGDEDLGEPPKSPERIEPRTGKQRPTKLIGNSPADPITVLDSELGSKEDAEDSVHLDNEGAKSSDEDRNDQAWVPDAALSDNGGKPSEDNVLSENEDMYDVSEDEDSENEPRFGLFGGAKSWEIVINGAKQVGLSRRKGKVVSRNTPGMETDTVQDLVMLMHELASLYRKVGSRSDRDSNHEAMEAELRAVWRDLSEAIDEIEESSASGDELLQSQLIQDIYAHAIPSMVFMLRAALLCRSRHYSEPNDIENLTEVVEIQDKIINLCEKARRWRARPMTDAPIMGTVAKGVLPYMRELRERHFGRELADRTDLARQEWIRAKFAESHEKVREQKRLQKERHHQQVLENRRRMYERRKELEELERRPRARYNRPQQKPHVDDISKAQSSHPILSDQWTKEQNLDLVQGLLSKDSRDLPGKSTGALAESEKLTIKIAQERYLAILNTPSLQNKLPEHIRDRALYYRQSLIDDMGEQAFLLSIE